MKRKFHSISTIAAFVALAGCAVGPDYRRPTVPLPDSFKEGDLVWQRVVPDQLPADGGEWWRDFGDTQLNGLVVQALRANQDLAKAQAAYRQAQASVRAARAQYMPSLGLDVSGSRGRTDLERQLGSSPKLLQTLGANPIAQTITAEASASWEPDFWGKLRRDVEAQRANVQSQAAEVAAERLSITTSLVNDYLSLRQSDRDIALLEREQSLNARLLAITEQSERRGVASGDDVLNAQNNLDAAKVTLANARIARAQYEHAIAVLCGQAPGKLTVAPRNDYRFVEATIPVTLPSQLLRRRPDIAAAERQVAAANAQIGVAKAAYFPSLQLTAGSGYSNNAWAGLFEAPNRVWSLGPQLAETLFDGGARHAAVAQARAGYDAAVAGYRQSVLSAFQEVEDGLSSLDHLREQREYQGQVMERQGTLLEHVHAQQMAGTASDEDLINQQLKWLTAERNASDAAAEASEASVTLIAALGGTAPMPAVVGIAATASIHDHQSSAAF